MKYYIPLPNSPTFLQTRIYYLVVYVLYHIFTKCRLNLNEICALCPQYLVKRMQAFQQIYVLPEHFISIADSLN